jgi:hypothetical protein
VGVLRPVQFGWDHNAEDCSGLVAHGEVVGWPIGLPGDQVGDVLQGLRELVKSGRAQLGHGQGELDPLVHVGQFAGADSGEDLAEGTAHGFDGAKAGRLGAEGIGEERVEFVGEDEVFLGEKVPEAGGRRDFGRLGDLINRRGLVTLPSEQPQGLVLDSGAGFGLLAFSEAGSWRVVRRWLGGNRLQLL